MKRFLKDLKKYREYIGYSGISLLKADVSGSFLSWLWWILDPFLHMMVYAFITVIVFSKSEAHFIPFVFIGQGVWKFIYSSVMGSVKMIRSNKSVLSRIYLPKQILLLSNMFSFFIQFIITMCITFVISAFDHVEISWYVLWFPYLVCLLFLGTFGISCILLHIGVYIKDMSNIVSVIMKLCFYLCGIFYSIPKRVPAPYGRYLLALNPAAMIINEVRNILIYQTAPDYKLVAAWTVLSIILTYIGINLVYKHEQNYIKAV